MNISYNWLKWYIPEAPEAEKLVDIFNYHLCEVESLEKKSDGDIIFDIKVLPNRAHDLLSHQGVARELASLLNIKFVDPTPKYKIPESKLTNLKIEIESDKCRRYMGRIIRNVKVGPSPEWVVKHLESVGQRSINNMVDAANIVMFDCGQPTHVFDLDKVSEKLVARMAKDSEKMTTLDNKDCKLETSHLVIADAKNVLAVAGIKGGKIAEVNNDTKNIILEVANFDPTSVRKTAQALNIVTDAKKRFENDLSPELGSYAMLEFSALILEMCPLASFEDVVDVYPKKQEVKKLSFSVDKISKILGVGISIDEIKNILKKYNFEYSEDRGSFEITVPPMRLDLVIEEDMAEEVGRILGYDKVKGNIPKINFKPKVNETYSKILWARHKLLNDGYSEVMNTSFSNKGEVSVLASASDKNFLRTNLSDGLKESVKLNQANAPLLGVEQAKVFEIGTVFKKSGEEMHIAFGNKKEVKEMTLNEFCKEISEQNSSALLQPSAGTFRQQNSAPIFKMWSLFPFIARDMAVWVGEDVKSSKVEKIIKENMGEVVVRGPELFDEFKKDGKISYAFRLVFQSYERTLTDQEVNDIMTKITNKIKENNGWQVR
ncbi:MAG: phenylalanine--tRNA ligase subunit beta [Candidatus Pacebacteria bacterium]|nr:phenylalanine--tRNA ligase subunit beta [Candidatus Paceibacterota bacterium]